MSIVEVKLPYFKNKGRWEWHKKNIFYIYLFIYDVI